MTFGLTPQGFNAERLADIVNDLNGAMVAQFGDINTAPQSVFGQIIGVMAKSYADLWENLNDVYLSQYPNSAESVSLDNVVGLNGITRMPQTQTKVFASCFGNEGTAIPINALAAIPNTNDIFYAVTGATITKSAADFVSVAVNTSLAAQAYTIQLNSIPFIYSLPLITFTGSFVSGNSIVVNINGVSLTPVPYNTSTNQTLMDIATEISNDGAVASATANTGAKTIAIVPNLGFSVTVNFIQITSGASQPTYAVTFITPANVGNVSNYLTAVINAANLNFTATNLTGALSIATDNEEQPFNAAVGANLSITTTSSPILFAAQEYGPIACPVNALTQILTPIFGWVSVNNVDAGILGAFQETDAALRLRRQNSLRLQGLATIESIQSHLLDVPSVTSVTIFENRSLYQMSSTITFSGAVLTGQTITVGYNSIGTLTVNFNTNMATTMGLLAAQFLTIPAVSTAVVSGAGSTVLTLGFSSLFELNIDSVSVSGSGTLPTALIVNGQPAKSYQCVVEGGTNADVANEIWLSKPAGIETFGNTEQDIIDSQGNTQAIFFTRPVAVYIWVNAVLTLDSNPNDPFPVNGIEQVQTAIVNYINGLFEDGQQQIPALGVGNSVFLQRVQAQIFTVPGVASAVVTIAATSSQNTSPSFGTSDIVISNSQIAVTNTQLVTVSS